MFACDALRPPPSPAAPLTPPPSPAAPPNPPRALAASAVCCSWPSCQFTAVLRLLSGHGVGKCVGGVGGSSVQAAFSNHARTRLARTRPARTRLARTHAARTHAARTHAFSSPFDEHSRGNQDAIMIRVLSHRWHSAGEESDHYSVRSSRAARETACAAQAQERERRCVSTPSRHSRGGERHAREGGQPPLSRASSTRRAPACAARVCKQEQQRVSMPSQRSRGDERHARGGNQLRKSRAASGILRPRTRAGAAA